MTYPINFLIEVFSPSKMHEDLSKPSNDAKGALITDMVIALFVIAIGGFAFGQVGHLATLPEVASVIMMSAGTALIAVDWVLFAVTKVNPETVEEQKVIEGTFEHRKPVRPPAELPKKPEPQAIPHKGATTRTPAEIPQARDTKGISAQMSRIIFDSVQEKERKACAVMLTYIMNAAQTKTQSVPIPPKTQSVPILKHARYPFETE